MTIFDKTLIVSCLATLFSYGAYACLAILYDIYIGG